MAGQAEEKSSSDSKFTVWAPLTDGEVKAIPKIQSLVSAGTVCGIDPHLAHPPALSINLIAFRERGFTLMRSGLPIEAYLNSMLR